MYARAGNILLSLLGPAYFGFMHSPYVVLVVWSAACAAIFFWSNRRMVKKLKLPKDKQFVELRCKLAEAPENVR